MKRTGVILIILTAVVLCCSACSANYTGNPNNQSTSCANITMGSGKFAFDNGFIYFTDLSHVYEYDTESKTSVVLDTKDSMISDLYVQDAYVYYNEGGLRRMTKDGKQQKKIFDAENGCTQMFVEDKYAWFLESVEGNLIRKDLASGKEEVILSQVMSYALDDKNVYAVSKDEDVPVFQISDKEKISFAGQELSFSPITVMADDGAAYLAERGTYQVIKYSSEKEEKLPVFSLHYQAAGQKLYYLDANENGSCPLMQYDMETGEQTRIGEAVYDFCILDDKYVCMQCPYETFEKYNLYDISTGTTTLMYDTGEEE